MNLESILFLILATAFDLFLFWMSNKEERMRWMRDPSDPVIQRLVTRTAAWIILAFIVFSVFSALVVT